MKSARYIGALAVIYLAMISPTWANVIADQSRLSPLAPQVPGLEEGIWHATPVDTSR